MKQVKKEGSIQIRKVWLNRYLHLAVRKGTF